MNVSTVIKRLGQGLLFAGLAGSASAQLLGVDPGYPNIDFQRGSGGSPTVYTASTTNLTVTAVPVRVTFVAGTAGNLINLFGTKSVNIKIQIDNAGNLIGGVSGPDLEVKGDVTDSITGTPYNGTLLTGEILDYGIANEGVTDFIDYRFQITGGLLAPLYAPGEDIGVFQLIESSTYNGSFATNWTGDAKGNIGPITPVAADNGSLGDYVFADADADGVQDNGENGINGVRVVLSDGNGNFIADTTTFTGGPNNSPGFYEFTGLAAGDYIVSVDQTSPALAGLVPSPLNGTPNPALDSNDPTGTAVTLATDENNPTLDYGFSPPANARLGNFIWLDDDRDGIQDPGEAGINGVTVRLLDADNGDALVATTTTFNNGTNNGFYEFTGLFAGNYKVVVDESTLPALNLQASPAGQGGDMAADSNVNGAVVNLAVGENNPTIDFGYNTIPDARLGDFVWFDTNRDGIQQAGEPGINGVTLELLNDTGNVITTTTTSTGGVGGVAGFYEFTGLPAGNYTVRVDLSSGPLAGLVQTPADQGTDDTIDSDGALEGATLAESENNPTLDFGFNSPATGAIGNFVWLDTDRDGIQDAGEPGIDGVPVKLVDANGNTVATTVTGLSPDSSSSGYYNFGGLTAGTYTVMIDDSALLSSGLIRTDIDQGGDDALDSDGPNIDVTLVSDTDTSFINDAGYQPAGTAVIGDFLWNDANGDGIQDADDTGINGVTIKLLDDLGNLVATTTTQTHPTTGEPGYYQFTGLVPGDYTVMVNTATVPAGYTESPVGQGGDPELDSNGLTFDVTVGEADNNQSLDIGLTPPANARIGDFVWNDVDRDGQQDSGEPGINNVRIVLKDAGGVIVATTTTRTVAGEAGFYEFTGLLPGTYTVEVDATTLPAGQNFVPTGTLVGASDTDSDPSPSTVTLDEGENNPTIDFGFFQYNGAIGDTIFNDVDGNGVQDGGDGGLAGVTVTLTDGAGNVLATTTTDGNGFYNFGNLPAGDYMVLVDADDLPAGSVGTADPDGLGSPNKSTLTLGVDEVNDDQDFGYTTGVNGEIGDFVWRDLNGDGIQDSGEPGISGVTVTLTDSFGNTFSTVTGVNGEYLFPNLPSDTYTISIDGNTLPAGLLPTYDLDGVATANTATVFLGSGETNLLVDFGYNADFANCGECEGKVTYLEFQYTGPSGVFVEVFQKKGANGPIFSGTLNTGDIFDVTGVAKKGTLSTEISIEVNGVVTNEIHTSCSVEIGAGSVYGDFTVLTGTSRNGGTLCPVDGVPPTDPICDKCEGGVSSITARYEGTETGRLEVFDVKYGGLLFSRILSPGESFTVAASGADKLPKNIKFKFEGDVVDWLHTSCSDPIAPGLVLGSIGSGSGGDDNSSDDGSSDDNSSDDNSSDDSSSDDKSSDDNSSDDNSSDDNSSDDNSSDDNSSDDNSSDDDSSDDNSSDDNSSDDDSSDDDGSQGSSNVQIVLTEVISVDNGPVCPIGDDDNSCNTGDDGSSDDNSSDDGSSDDNSSDDNSSDDNSSDDSSSDDNSSDDSSSDDNSSDDSSSDDNSSDDNSSDDNSSDDNSSDDNSSDDNSSDDASNDHNSGGSGSGNCPVDDDSSDDSSSDDNSSDDSSSDDDSSDDGSSDDSSSDDNSSDDNSSDDQSSDDDSSDDNH